MKSKRCRVCREVYSELLEIRRVESTGFCTACKWSNPFCQPEILRLWNLNRNELDEVLAERFALPLRTIHELLDCCIEEELFDLLSDMEEAEALTLERGRLEWKHHGQAERSPAQRADRPLSTSNLKP